MSDHLIWTCDRPNIALHLRDREIGFGKAPAYRRNCRIWRTLICDKSSVYKKTWSLTSKTKIYYLGDRLYLDDFRTCYSLNGPHAMPTAIYKSPDKSHTYKLEANLHCSAELDILPMVNGEHRPYVLGLTKCQNLIRIDLQTGQILKKIYLGHHHSYLKYIYLNWDVFQERAVVCSTQTKSATGMMKSFVLFGVFPLEVIGHLTVTQQVFGTDICNANISDGMLIVMHRYDRVRIYNLDEIINENMKFELRLGEVARAVSASTVSSSSGVVGSFPTGIPVNIQITDRPPILLEVTSLHHDVWFGGFPWHYMYIPHTKDGLLAPNSDPGTETYLVASVETNQMVASGILEMDSDSDDVTMAFFHMDDSQRIIQLGDYDLIVNAFHTRTDGKSELQVIYRVRPPVNKSDLEGEKGRKDHNWETTLSGRRVSTQWRKQLRVRNKIRDVNFDSELDFLLVTFVTTAGSSPVGAEGTLGIHCNQTGRLLKMVDLNTVDCDAIHGSTLIEMDMDFMVHICETDPRGKVTCTLYRLQRPVDCAEQDKATQLHQVRN